MFVLFVHWSLAENAELVTAFFPMAADRVPDELLGTGWAGFTGGCEDSTDQSDWDVSGGFAIWEGG